MRYTVYAHQIPVFYVLHFPGISGFSFVSRDGTRSTACRWNGIPFISFDAISCRFRFFTTPPLYHLLGSFVIWVPFCCRFHLTVSCTPLCTLPAEHCIFGLPPFSRIMGSACLLLCISGYTLYHSTPGFLSRTWVLPFWNISLFYL